MAGQYRFKDDSGNIVAQISASVEGAIAFSGSVVDFSQANNVILGNVQLAGTASNALLLDGFDSQAFAFTSSIHPFTASTNSRLNSLEEKTGSLATTGSNTFFGTQTFTGSVYISENLIVQGSSSLQNITASAVDIGTNKIILNVDNPAVRYAGISVYDSGSTGGTGSLWWDSLDNHWVYEHPSDSAAPYNSAILISGPKNAGNLGEELDLVSNYIVKAVGGDHISSSAIYDDGTTIGLKSNTEISGTFRVGVYTSSFEGIVGIGRTAPEFTLDVNGDIALNRTNKLMFAGGVVGDRSRSYITGDGNNNLYIYGPSSNLHTTFKYTGEVGIGTTNPASSFEIYSSDSSGTRTNPHNVITITAENANLPYTGFGGGIVFKNRTYNAGITTGARIRSVINYDGYAGQEYGTSLAFDTTPNTGSALTQSLIIRYDGNVGVGVTNPSNKFTVGHASHGIGMSYLGSSSLPSIAGLFTSDGTAGGQTGYGSLLIKARTDYGGVYSLNFFTATTSNSPVERMTITSGGYTGIGNPNPQAKLDLGTSYSGGTYRNAFFLYNDNNSGPYYGTKNGFYMDQFSLSNNTTLSFSTAAGAPGTLYFASKNTEVSDATSLTPRMVIAGQTGNVGIGITNNVHKLQVQGNLNLSGMGLMRTYFAQSFTLGAQFDIFRFLTDSGSIFAQSGISGILFINAQDTNTGGNQISYTFHLQTNGNGTSQANITQMSYQLRGTQPIQSIGLQNDGSGGGVKVVGSVVGSGVGGCNVWATFVGVAV